MFSEINRSNKCFAFCPSRSLSQLAPHSGMLTRMVRTSSNHTVASQSFKEHRHTFVRRFVIPGPRCPTAGRTPLLYSFFRFPTSRRPLFRRPLSVRECKGKRFFRTTKFYFQKVFSKIKSGTIPLPLLHSQRTFPVKRAAKISKAFSPQNKFSAFCTYQQSTISRNR